MLRTDDYTARITDSRVVAAGIPLNDQLCPGGSWHATEDSGSCGDGSNLNACWADEGQRLHPPAAAIIGAGVGLGICILQAQLQGSNPDQPWSPFGRGPQEQKTQWRLQQKDTSITQVQCVFEQLFFVWLCSVTHLRNAL